MPFELLKILVQPIIAERDERGKIVGEQQAQVVPCYTPEQVLEVLDLIGKQIAQANSQPTNGKVDMPPIESVQTVEISCDNPNCPGHPDLNPNDRTGWLFINSEVYGEPTKQHVFGSVECLNAATSAESAPAIFAPDPSAPSAPMGPTPVQ